MKKALFVLFTMLFVFKGNAQSNPGGLIYFSSDCFAAVDSKQIAVKSLAAAPVVTFYQWVLTPDIKQYKVDNTFGYIAPYQTPELTLYTLTQQVSVNGSNKILDLYDSIDIIRFAIDMNTNQRYQSNVIRVYLKKFATPGVLTGNDTICSGSPISGIVSTPATSEIKFSTISYEWIINQTENGIFDENYTPNEIATNQWGYYYYRNVTFTHMVDNTYASCQLQSNIVGKIVMNCGIFSTNITGITSISSNQTATYSVPATVGMQYAWTVTGGTITSGQGTNSIDVIWDGGTLATARTTAVPAYSVSVTETDATPESRTITQNITATTTAINKGFGSTGISVFPNPVKNQFTIEMPGINTNVTYTVYTATGLQVQSGSFNSIASGNTISSQLSAGIYQLVLNYDGVYTSTRLVVTE